MVGFKPICVLRQRLSWSLLTPDTAARWKFNPAKSYLIPAIICSHWTVVEEDGQYVRQHFSFTWVFLGQMWDGTWDNLLGDLVESWPGFSTFQSVRGLYDVITWLISHQHSDASPLFLLFYLSRTQIDLHVHTHSLSLPVSLVHHLFYVGHSLYIDRYFQCLGPQEISLGNFQRTDRPTFLPLNWSGQFHSLLVWHTKWHSDLQKWTMQISHTSCWCVTSCIGHPPQKSVFRRIKAKNVSTLWPGGQMSTYIIIQYSGVHMGAAHLWQCQSQSLGLRGAQVKTN